MRSVMESRRCVDVEMPTCRLADLRARRCESDAARSAKGPAVLLDPLQPVGGALAHADVARSGRQALDTTPIAGPEFIHEPGSWIALYNVQTDPEYGRFVWDVLGSAERIVRDPERVLDVRGFIFISASPPGF